VRWSSACSEDPPCQAQLRGGPRPRIPRQHRRYPGPGMYCPQRHHFEPRFIESTGSLSRGEQHVSRGHTLSSARRPAENRSRGHGLPHIARPVIYTSSCIARLTIKTLKVDPQFGPPKEGRHRTLFDSTNEGS